jgi:hypothetical protein
VDFLSSGSGPGTTDRRHARTVNPEGVRRKVREFRSHGVDI